MDALLDVWQWVTAHPWLSLLLVGFFWAGCPCCGAVACVSFVSDDFDDSTITGWTQTAGTWSESGSLIATSSNSAVLTSDTACPGSSSNFRVSTSVKASASGGVVRIRFASNGSTYHYAELKVGSGGYLRLYRSDGTLLDEVTGTVLAADTLGNLSVCAVDGAVTSQIGLFRVDATGETLAGDQFALATGSLGGGSASWDYAIATPTDGDCPTCPGLCSGCLNTQAAYFLEVTLPATAPDSFTTCTDCAGTAGTYIVEFVGDLSPVNGHTGCYWELLDTFVCTFDTLQVIRDVTLGTLEVVMFNSSSVLVQAHWTESIVGAIDCIDMNVDVTGLGVGVCIATGTTANVAAS